MADIMAFEKHEKLRAELMSAWARKPPAGYARLTVEQVQNADEVAFRLLSKATRKGIKRTGGERLLDAAMDDVLKHRDFNGALQHLPCGAGQRGADTDDDSGPRLTRTQKRQRRRDSQRARAPEQTAARSSDWGAPSKGQGKGKEKGKKGAGKSPSLPLALRGPGCTGLDKDNVPICFGYNLGQCTSAPPGGRCAKGRHVCISQHCLQTHEYIKNH